MRVRLPQKAVIILITAIVVISAVAVFLWRFSLADKSSDVSEPQPTEFVYIPEVAESDPFDEGDGLSDNSDANQSTTAPTTAPLPADTPTAEPKPTTGVPFYDAPRDVYSVLDVWEPAASPTPPTDYAVLETVETVDVEETSEPDPFDGWAGNPYSSVSPEGYLFTWESESHLIGLISSYTINKIFEPLSSLPAFIGTENESAACEALLSALADVGGITEMVDFAFADSERQAIWSEMAPMLDDLYDAIYSARITSDWQPFIGSDLLTETMAMKEKFTESWRQ